MVSATLDTQEVEHEEALLQPGHRTFVQPAHALSVNTTFMEQPAFSEQLVQPPQAPTLSMAETMESGLSEVLSATRLQDYEDALRDLGCTTPEDLCDLDGPDMEELGMKKVEVKRLQRLVAEMQRSKQPSS